ncbi:hypothetical protein CDAR_450531 [Caerostris darwini]|uniref:Uncharacterized protein n=1 Tax=Caerostris darwini TaxID=1538125 RepID=A0AAV4WRL8_9ARAC|nr:hypothetical protein CDAR_450531 [Caerostris darwini]
MRLTKSNMRLTPKKISKPFLRNAIMIGLQQQKSVRSGHGLGRRSTWLPCASHHPCGRELLLHPLSPSEMLFRGLFRSTKISSQGWWNRRRGFGRQGLQVQVAKVVQLSIFLDWGAYLLK